MKDKPQREWTQDRSGTSNASREYLRIVKVVELIVGNHRLGGDVHMLARNIVSELAHGQNIGPLPEPPTP